MTAAARNDFGGMGNDVFSKWIRDSIPENFGPFGFEGIKSTYIEKQSDDLFNGKTDDEVLLILNSNDGSCSNPTIGNQQRVENPLVCEVSRKWRLVNSGYPSFGMSKVSPPNWSEPGVKLIYRFYSSVERKVRHTELKIQNITSYPTVQ